MFAFAFSISQIHISIFTYPTDLLSTIFEQNTYYEIEYWTLKTLTVTKVGEGY